MKKLFVLSFGVLSINAFSQNDIQVFNLNNRSGNSINIQKQNVQAVQTFASNVQIKRASVRAVNNVKANPVNTIKSQVRRRVSPQRNRNTPVQIQQPLPKINFVNVPSQINPPANHDFNPIEQINDINVLILENNVGNSFGNEQMQQAAQNDDVQIGHAGDFLEGISLNLPKMNLKSIHFSKKTSSSKSAHKSFHLKNKFAKMNRKVCGKLSFKKRLRIKVDNCFKW